MDGSRSKPPTDTRDLDSALMVKIIEPILTPQDAPWGRQVNDRQDTQERDLSRFSLEQIATNKAVAASVQALSVQVRDLAGRVSYAVDGTGTTANWTTPQATPFAWGPSLTFTITEQRTVSIQFALRATAEGTATATTTNIIAAGRGVLFVNSGLIAGARGEIGAQVPSGTYSASRSDYAIGSLICRSLVTLPAGTHTVQGGFLFITTDVLGGSGTARVTAADPNIFVDVLQTIGA